MLTVIHDAARKAGLNASSLWGVAPHYVSATPNLAVSEALLRRLDAVFDFDLQLKDLARAAQRFTARVSSLVEEDPDVSAYVRELEQRGGWPDAYDSVDAGGADEATCAEGELPSAAQAIASVEELLRRSARGRAPIEASLRQAPDPPLSWPPSCGGMRRKYS